MALHQLTVLPLQLAVPLLIGLGFPCIVKDEGEEPPGWTLCLPFNKPSP